MSVMSCALSCVALTRPSIILSHVGGLSWRALGRACMHAHLSLWYAWVAQSGVSAASHP